jgi:hypothetical protein
VQKRIMDGTEVTLRISMRMGGLRETFAKGVLEEDERGDEGWRNLT